MANYKHKYKIGDKVKQIKFKDIGVIIDLLPLGRYRVEWQEMKNTNTYDEKYLKLSN